MNVELWKSIPDSDNGTVSYEISSFGALRSSRRMANGTVKVRVVKSSLDDRGYPQVCLNYYNGRGRRTMKVHRLIALVFMGGRPKGREVNHKDGNKTNNAIGNLEFVTHAENMKHAADNKLMRGVMGSRQKAAKLTEEQIPEIRRLLREGVHPKEIAVKYRVSVWPIKSIKYGVGWKHVP